jgi:hypothetical protein
VAEEFGGITGFGEDPDRARHLAGLIADGGEIGLMMAGEDEDVALGELPGDGFHELQAVESRHGDVAEDQFGTEGAGDGESFLAAVGDAGVEVVLAEDEPEGVCYELFIVYNEDSPHRMPQFSPGAFRALRAVGRGCRGERQHVGSVTLLRRDVCWLADTCRGISHRGH